MNRRRHLAMIVLGIALAGSARAHDFWILPSSFHPEPKTRVSIDLRVGEHLRGEPVARNPERIELFFVRGDGEPAPIAGVDGRAPAGYWSSPSEGFAWIGYRSRPSAVE